jgi:probable rRNA maturation factor
MPSVNFFCEEIYYKVPQPRALKKWIKAAIAQEGYVLNHLNFIFCSDGYLHKMNVEYLNHDTLTDIITFDNSEGDKEIEGDVFISVDRIKENASKFSTTERAELQRVIIHGVLHLVGYTDKTAKAKTEMRKKEDAYLSLLHSST